MRGRFLLLLPTGALLQSNNTCSGGPPLASISFKWERWQLFDGPGVVGWYRFSHPRFSRPHFSRPRFSRPRFSHPGDGRKQSSAASLGRQSQFTMKQQGVIEGEKSRSNDRVASSEAGGMSSSPLRTVRLSCSSLPPMTHNDRKGGSLRQKRS